MNFHPLSIGILTACVVIYAECLAQPLKIADDGRKEAQLQLGARISAPRSRSDQDLPLPPKRPGQLGTYDLLAPGKRLKAGRRTIAFLDDFEQAYALPILGKSRVAHGEISATAAEQNGFNVLRLQLNHKAIRWEYSADYSKVLTSIYDNVLAGNLKLKRGDIINISMGQPFQGLFGQPSFAEASDLLRLREPITAKNINDRAKQSEVLAALRAKLQEAELSKQLHERLRQVVETNEIIAKIQDRLGVQVVVAAGNNGPQRFELGLPDGQRAPGLDRCDRRFACRKRDRDSRWTGPIQGLLSQPGPAERQARCPITRVLYSGRNAGQIRIYCHGRCVAGIGDRFERCDNRLRLEHLQAC